MGVSVICLCSVSYVTYDHVVSHVFMLCDVCMGHGCHVRRCHIRVHCVCVMRLLCRACHMCRVSRVCDPEIPL